LARKEREIFAAIVKEQPKVGPLPLVVGHATADGPAPSVANISPALVNAERVKYERRKVLVSGSGGYRGDNFVKEFAKFAKSNPNFIRTSHFGQVAVIIMKTPFMASRLIKSVPVLDHDAVGGLVSDAAHGFCKEGNSQLIITSTYEPVHLKCCVPVLITYSNGGTEQHYQLHFFALFLGFAEECQRREIVLTDDMLANVSLEDFPVPEECSSGYLKVVDFSLAERNGFISAFVEFWRHWEPNGRTVAELRKIGSKLLKGCVQHFRNQIARVKKISGVVDPSQTDVFENYAKKLLKCTSVPEFTAHANEFIRTFPKAESWIRWWMHPPHARMLFPCYRIMDLELWNSLPGTKNPEEAMHWKLYAALGRHLALLEGLKALVAFAEYYRTQFEAKRRRFPSISFNARQY
jgi:hypothetical protein